MKTALIRPSIFIATTLVCTAAQSLAQEPPPDEQDPPPVRQGGGADPSDDAFEMGSPASLAEGLTEEMMWPAATAEGWKQPVLVRWQRTFDDAMRVARTENRPILVAVNMDGEIASEHFAGVRYRDPETAALMEGYVSVIASVYRHTPRDYDEEGNRVTCPRFGTVTCGEHIQAERELYDKYFDGRRISPRHIVLDLDGNETYDVYYSWDTATVFTTYVKGVEGWPEPNELVEPTVYDFAKSARVEHRELLERAYVEGDRQVKRQILVALEEERVVDQVEVLRSAIFGFDLELATIARRALAQCDTDAALDLTAEALQTPLDPAERELLLDNVERLGETSKRARTLAALHSGLSVGSRHIDTDMMEDLAREYEASASRTINVQGMAEAAEARPEAPEAQLELAEALIARADDTQDRRFAKLLLDDARQAALKAEELGAEGPRLDAAIALTAVGYREYATAQSRAVAAVEGGLLRSGDDAESEGTLSDASKMRLLRLFAQARQRAIREAYRADGEWPPEWLSDVNAAYATISEGPLVDEWPLVDYHDFLRWIGATPRANEALDDALERFPDSAVLHERLRARLLWEGGPKGLEAGYDSRLAREGSSEIDATQLTWFAGYASLVAAEHYRRRNEFDAAVQAYARAIAHYERNIELFPDGRDTSDHFIALGLAGRARVALEHGELDTATDALLASFELRPGSAATPDGLSLTPVMTAKMLKARLLDAGNAEGAERVQAAMDALDPKLLEPPPTELPGTRRQGRRGGGRNG